MKTQETRVTSTSLDPDARKDDDLNSDTKDPRNSRQVVIKDIEHVWALMSANRKLMAANTDLHLQFI